MAHNTSTLPEAYDFDTILRELSWLNKTSPIWQSSNFITHSLGNLFQTDLHQAARDLERIWSWNGVPRRLGRRFEALLIAYFEHAVNSQLLGHEITVYKNKISMGEIDLILKLEQQIVHLEIALKFYAGIQTGLDVHWIGPSCKDYFEKKKMHVLNHQLPLAEKPECIRRLKALNLPIPSQSIGLIFGYLMQPWNTMLNLDEDMIQTSKSFWCTHDLFHDAARRLSKPYGGAYGWRYIPRAQWTAPHYTNATLPLLPNISRPDQADCYILVPKYSHAMEKLRLFVLPNNFPKFTLDLLKRC